MMWQPKELGSTRIPQADRGKIEGVVLPYQRLASCNQCFDHPTVIPHKLKVSSQERDVISVFEIFTF